MRHLGHPFTDQTPATSVYPWLDTCNGLFPPPSSSECTRLTSVRLGVKTRIFHLGDYRRATVGQKGDVPEDYFFPNASPASVMLRQKILKKCREDIYAWLNHENGQVAIYDAVNPTSSGRRSLAKEFAKHDVQVSSLLTCRGIQLTLTAVQTLFLESFVDDEKLLRENARNVKINSPDVSHTQHRPRPCLR
jgi:6-phosphofructo-2-kinase / fructose-2,6-biphosphatase 4